MYENTDNLIELNLISTKCDTNNISLIKLKLLLHIV